MGVPRFFRWLSERYHEILSDILTDYNTLPPVDMLFLDMNGIIHYASHGNGMYPPERQSLKEIFERIEKELVHLVEEIVKPSTLVYIAIDGVAPRAKLNQQRSRRYRAAKDREDKIAESAAEKILEEKLGKRTQPKPFDSNCITPGTEFMHQVSERLLAFIRSQKISSGYWNSLNIVFSGAEVPGEGEHKIISYIREMKEQHLLSPNSKYCLYAADADMIMLGLAIHEPYVVVLREITLIDTSTDRKTHSHGRHGANNVTLSDMNNNWGASEASHGPSSAFRRMQYIRINVLRQYLINEFSQDFLLSEQPFEALDWGDEDEDNEIGSTDLKKSQKNGEPLSRSSSHSIAPGGEINFENVIDDFIFLTFFVGNDFLPHLPGLDIGDHAFDIIFDAYKTVFSTHPGYLVRNAKIDYGRLELIFSIVGASEAVIYEEKQIAEGRRFKKQFRDGKTLDIPPSENQSTSSLSSPAADESRHDRSRRQLRRNRSRSRSLSTNDSRSPSRTPSLDFEVGHVSIESHPTSSRDNATARQKYYRSKFGFDPDDSSFEPDKNIRLFTGVDDQVQGLRGPEMMKVVVKEYLQGLEWCLAYYTKGCISWNWFYPFHYGPFLQDMVRLKEVSASISFDLSTPLLPFQQLLACLPPQSAELLPPQFHHLMLARDSPLISFYPTDFKTDMNGKKRDYEAVVLLPFINISQLRQVSETCMENLATEDRLRNEFGKIHYFMPYQSDEQLFDFKITPSQAFRSELLPGTAERLEEYPSLGEVTSFGKALYFAHGKSHHHSKR